MAVFNEPTQWTHTLGNNADVSTLPDDTSATSGAASLQKLFQIINQTPLEAGGVAPSREDFNALFKFLGDSIFYMQNGGLWSYNSAFDYAVGRVVLYTDGNLYKCIQANSALDPKAPTDSAYWTKITTLADVANAFANQDLSNLSATGLSKFANPSFSNINNTAKIAIAHNSAVSFKFDTLTLGTSGTNYTAPADGYFAFQASLSNGNIHWHIMNGSAEICACRIDYTNSGAQSAITTPLVKKGSVMRFTYSGITTTNYFKFIYAVGSESEQ